ncbi:CAP domain-containing protein [Bacillus sp. DJP31]|uniref:CAP domain-containing protein n=1 Tax=Bacillus sp. DJP31 TaxID=3409789 RepID=UPI003BB6B778
MRRLLLFISFLILLYMSWDVIEKQIGTFNNQVAIETIKTEIDMLKDNPEISNAITSFFVGLNNFLGQLDQLKEKQGQDLQTKTPPVEKPILATPTEQIFSIYNIQLGDSKADAEQQLGVAKRSSLNEYGVDWHTYHENYQNFMMVGYDEFDNVVGLYSNQDLISSTKGITFGSNKELVSEQLGEPLTSINKGMVYYQFEEKRDYEMYLLNDSYVSIFYDKHQENIVTSIQIISKDLEDKRSDYYTASSEGLKEGFEYQLFDLTNATRVNHGLQILEWDDRVRETARKHSLDMADNNYFSHTNLEGQSPFDRMLEDDIAFTMAGENLAYGQFSSIFAHEGLMNSLGHRENILQADFRNLGVGVAFNEKAQPYYTEKFFSQ